MRTDSEIKSDILEELAWQPNVDETEIGVVVEDGTVMLTGVLDDYRKKVAAEDAVKNVRGVKALVGDIQVKYGANYQKTDLEISKAIVKAFEWNTAVPEDEISVEVRDGWVNLSGEVDWAYQKDAAKRVAENIIGVKWINNAITIKQSIQPADVKEQINKAFLRSADIEANAITVEATEGLVKLFGTVHSIAEKKAAEDAAYLSPGVHIVINELEVID
ncbi:osmotically-inducible protein OsmY [Winogradskyella eximia]|jgi:osmotically-inducible protein OsmY|uniref:Osmotically-inducible protein OsmY n=1 Tax=Winogradskyella eximia TaxID=262006 RepID=A0A3D9H2E5_9FLAO|nr:BON domain-containing protein [Winogradskyella eximia]RED43655.1 osmotically-inducible protein OsmY [Winogradskyella eximia]|tara:strand:- start:392 stop:1045 length:654 start_codon:yes stop_codon:yes gene_type:complete